MHASNRARQLRIWGLRLMAPSLISVSLLASAAPSPPPSDAAVNEPAAILAPSGPDHGIANQPKTPDLATKDQTAGRVFRTDREERLSYSILFFGLLVLSVQYLLLRSPVRSAFEILQLLAINLVVTGTLFLISAGFEAQQIAPGLGLFGTVAGYVLGRRANTNHDSKDETS